MSPVAAVSQEGDDLLVRPLIGMLPEMKTLGATWDRRRSSWKLPAARMHLQSVKDLLVSVQVADLPMLKEPDTTSDLSDKRLFSWQRTAVERLLAAPTLDEQKQKRPLWANRRRGDLAGFRQPLPDLRQPLLVV